MSKLSEIISQEINRRGVIPFSRFMELALYCPEFGYYEMEKDIGRRGDFYTSVSVGSLFGELLAFQFAEWIEALPSRGARGAIVEAGAHRGQLARDILSWLRSHRPGLLEKIDYWVVEPSARRRDWQQATLKEFAARVRWLPDLNHASSRQLHGVIFSNELLDALPVHRLGWDSKNQTWFEWGVRIENQTFRWAKIPDPAVLIPNPPPAELLAVLPEGYTIEICPQAERWWSRAAQVLDCGKLVTIDYGLSAEEWFSPARPQGTLRAFFAHHATGEVLARPGEQDLTAHVNFSAIQQAGEQAGLATQLFCTQSQFLTAILDGALKKKALDGWTSVRARQFQTLTHPEHLGRAFRVLVQSRPNPA